ncbi:MAG: CRISPR-associated ring nuclease Csm6 [Kiritimatiellae bacterium]|nr:CRISPR-associated ring nuclease Csm6 [Kiritimatiellia bacterium]
MATTRADERETVLVAVTGMSPAILTETVWALAHERPATRVRRVIAFCTTQSAASIRRELLESGVWERLRRTLKAGDDEFVFGDTGDHLRVFTRRGHELEDLRTPEDNTAAADFILEHLRAFVENPDVHVVASIAGGRKTMGALIYAAMTLIGRETDRVTHVLVSENLERRREPRFYFPASSQEARQIVLADIPFVPLRNRFQDLGSMPGSFSMLVRRYAQTLVQDRREPVKLLMDDMGRRFRVDVSPWITLRPRAYAVLRFCVDLAERGVRPRAINVPEEEFRSFLDRHGWSAAFPNLDMSQDIRRELHHIRRVLAQHSINWGPGQRTEALVLPPFKLVIARGNH